MDRSYRRRRVRKAFPVLPRVQRERHVVPDRKHGRYPVSDMELRRASWPSPFTLALVGPKAHGMDSNIDANRIKQGDPTREALRVEFHCGVRRLSNGVVRRWQLAEVSGLVVIAEAEQP